MRMYDILHAKRQKEPLTDAQIRWFVAQYTSGAVPDYQAAALCMAICCQGMTAHETAVLTEAMCDSGDRLDLSAFGEKSVDKHSTGGVGDKTTLIVAPLVASLGGYVAKMSGRGLGHTGGTVDKLSAIPGYRVSLPQQEFLRVVGQTGVAVVGQSGELAPADKRLYALRDVTATVDSIPLIASSIMSKKLASGAHSIVLDVKVGSGAFMKTEEEAVQLGEAMLAVGRACGRRMAVCLTDMEAPLGFAVGNALEVAEAAAVLRGEGPQGLRQVSLSLAAQMLSLCHGWDPAAAEEQAARALADGRALRTAEQWVAAQGGDPHVWTAPSLLPQAACQVSLPAWESGYITSLRAEEVGAAAMALGAGRRTKEEEPDLSAGIVLQVCPGQYVARGEPLAVLHAATQEQIREGEQRLRQAISFSPLPPAVRPLVHRILV